jgi:hypothetical protein
MILLAIFTVLLRRFEQGELSQMRLVAQRDAALNTRRRHNFPATPHENVSE